VTWCYFKLWCILSTKKGAKKKSYFQCHQFRLIIHLLLAQNQCYIVADVAKRWQEVRLRRCLYLHCNAKDNLTFWCHSRNSFHYVVILPLSFVICSLSYSSLPHYAPSFLSPVLLDLSLSRNTDVCRHFKPPPHALTYYSFRKIWALMGHTFF
jgi:hypothetical protein